MSDPTRLPYPAELYPGCPCYACDQFQSGETMRVGFATRMSLCPTCGNKRCPGAVNHRNTCSHSNELGQAGSFFASSPPQFPTPDWPQERIDAQVAENTRRLRIDCPELAAALDRARDRTAAEREDTT